MAEVKKVRTFYPQDMIDSIREQTDKVAQLVAAAQALLKLNPDLKGADVLRKAVDECFAAMWPRESAMWPRE